jgi:nicotinamide phosphoribosyltransferase
MMMALPYPVAPIHNRILWADAYTVGSHDLVSAAMRDRAAYQLTFRRFAPPAGLEVEAGERMIFHGLPRILWRTLGQPLQGAEVDEAVGFLRTFHAGGLPFPIDEGWWRQIVALGHFPVRIWALPDGATCRPGQPVVQVIAEPGFGELAAHLEARLVQVWAPSARASVMRAWLEVNEGLVRRTTDVADPDVVRIIAQWQTSDFGDRGGSCPEESEVLGMAHLTSHVGTDTMSAAYLAHQASAGRVAGQSIRALAHRVVQGHAREEDAFGALFALTAEGGIGSYVGDCYDFRRAVDEHLVPLAREAARTGGTVVARPDSGDGVAQLLYVLEAARRAGLSRVNGKGLHEMTSLRTIYADGLELARIREINAALEAAGYAPPMCNVFGVGGALRDGLSREMMGATYKLCAVGAALEPVAKLSPGGKHSTPGLVGVSAAGAEGPTVWPASMADAEVEGGFGALRLVYDRGRFTAAFEEDCDLARTRARVLDEWRAPRGPLLHPELEARLDVIRARHGVGR